MVDFTEGVPFKVLVVVSTLFYLAVEVVVSFKLSSLQFIANTSNASPPSEATKEQISASLAEVWLWFGVSCVLLLLFILELWVRWRKRYHVVGTVFDSVVVCFVAVTHVAFVVFFSEIDFYNIENYASKVS